MQIFKRIWWGVIMAGRIVFLFANKIQWAHTQIINEKNIPQAELQNQQVKQPTKSTITNTAIITTANTTQEYFKNLESSVEADNNLSDKTKQALQQRLLEQQQNKEEQKKQERQEKLAVSETVSVLPHPSAKDLSSVTFFSQAPYGDRSYPYQEACEESSFLLAYYYVKWIQPTKEQYHQDLLKFIELENTELWFYKDTTVQQLVQVIKERDDSVEIGIINSPTVRQLEKQLAQWNIIVAPFYGKNLKNPYYSWEGPDYHMMTIKGYDTENFIVHDVGTSRGENRKYNKQLIIDSIHDYDERDIRMGESRVIVLKR